MFNIVNGNKKIHKMIYYIHIPKCAGSTIRYALKNDKRYKLCLDNNDPWKGCYNINHAYGTHNVGNQQKNSIKVILGHYRRKKYQNVDSVNNVFITFLRNPVERVISHYFYFKFLRNREEFKNIPEIKWFSPNAFLYWWRFI